MKKKIILSLSLLIASLTPFCQTISSEIKPRMRVIVDNDFSGDPDGLFQMAHLLLSPSVDIRGIIGSHLSVKDGFDPSATQAENAAKKAKELLQIMNLEGKVPVVSGSNTGMTDDNTPVKSAGVDLIINEALRTDTKQPLYVLCGAGLTEIASALLTKPEIAGKLTLIWIGGPEYVDIALPPPGYSKVEYNLNIDPNAAMAVFNKTAVKLWQIPRNVYRQALFPYSHLVTKVKPQGKLGEYLYKELHTLMSRVGRIGETYILGDSPLVLFTALQSYFEADPSSSFYVVKQAPKINSDGQYQYNYDGRNIRVYTQIDNYLMFSDLLAKLEMNSNQH
jgi:inosine-uridine nucleoside N-ribohydrolase